MNELTAQEQLEVMKRWAKQYAPPIALALVLVGGGYYGSQWWQASQEKKSHAASDLYGEFIRTTELLVPGSQISDQRVDEARLLSDTLREDYDGTLYGSFASSHLARFSALTGDLDAALSDLQNAIESSDDEGVNHILRTRIARVLQEQGKLDEALQELQDPDPAFEGLFARQRGSIYQQMGENQTAIEQYRIAMLESTETNPNYAAMLQMLVDQLEASE